MILVTLLSLLSAPFLQAQVEWFCKPTATSNYRPIQSYDCSSMGQGTVYCRTPERTQTGKCGEFTIQGDKIQATYKDLNGKTRVSNIAQVRLKPEETMDDAASAALRGTSETTGFRQQRSGPRRTNPLANRFPPRTAKFSESRKTADSYTNSDWREMDYIQQAKYIMEVSTALTAAHGLPYSPRIIACKAFRESHFRPQDTAPGSRSTAAGLSQVTKSTIRDLFNRGNWFKSKVPGFTEVTSGNTYYSNMAGSMVAQLEIGIAVLHQKSKDTGSSNIKTILANYYGTVSESKNQAYANAIYNCADCIKTAGDVTLACLNKARK